MSINKVYYLYCTDCRKEYKTVEEFIRELRACAKINGWKYIKVKNGSYWDFCPDCYKIYKKNKEL